MPTTPKKKAKRASGREKYVTVARFDAAIARIDEHFRHLNSIVEDMRSLNRATLEAVLSLRKESQRDIADLRAEILPRLDAITVVVREHS